MLHESARGGAPQGTLGAVVLLRSRLLSTGRHRTTAPSPRVTPAAGPASCLALPARLLRRRPLRSGPGPRNAVSAPGPAAARIGAGGRAAGGYRDLLRQPRSGACGRAIAGLQAPSASVGGGEPSGRELSHVFEAASLCAGEATLRPRGPL